MRLTTKVTKTTKILTLGAAVLASTTLLVAQNPPPTPPQNPPPAQPGQPGQRGGGQGRGGVSIMSLTTTAWPDGGQIALKHTQVGDEASPPLTWSNVPEGIASFVLIVRDMDALGGRGATEVLHWMVWNIPGAARSLPEAIAQGPELPDGSRQISNTGPNYRGPGAPAAGPVHHYLFELFALDNLLEVPAVGASPADTRTAILAAMTGHVRAKGTLVGLFKRAQ